MRTDDQLQVSQEKGSASAQVVVEIQKEDFEESEPAQEAAYLAQYYANLAGADGGDANAEEIYSRPVSDGEETEEEEFEVVETVVTQNPSKYVL